MATIQLTRPPQTDDELYWLVGALWGVLIPRHKVCPDHVAPFTAFADAFFARSPVAVWKASRGFGGKSRALANLVLTEAAVLGAQANILGGSGGQSANVYEAMDEYWSSPNAPQGLLKTRNNLYTSMHNGASIRALMASSRAVRGPHPQRLRLDEIDEMDMAILDSAMGQPMASKGIESHTVMSSTHQYADGTMTAIIKRANEKGWPVFEWCFRDTSNPIDGWLTQQQIKRKRSEVTSAMWSIEYDLQEPSAGTRAIDTTAVKEMFDASLGTYSLENSSREFWVFEEPDRHGDYITGVDWAKEHDWTVIVTFRTDCNPWRLVAYARMQRLPWPRMVRVLDRRVGGGGGNRTHGLAKPGRWNGYRGAAAHDATGVGNVVHDYTSIEATGHVLTGQFRDNLLSDYIGAIEDGKVVAPMITSMYSEHLYATLDDVYGRGKDYHLPDTICAGAMAWSLRNRPAPKVQLPDDMDQQSHWRSAP